MTGKKKYDLSFFTLLGVVLGLAGSWAINAWGTMMIEGGLVHQIGWPGHSWSFWSSLLVSVAFWWVSAFFKTDAIGRFKVK